MDNFIGEIQLYGFNFAPVGWAQCNGATLAISQYSALFALLGTNYGGNGTSTFQLPNLFDSAACNQGQGPGLSNRSLGEVFGTPGVTLQIGQLPAHSHAFSLWNQTDSAKRRNQPVSGAALLVPLQTEPYPEAGTSPNVSFSPNMCGPAGQSQPHENRQPALAINYCIALTGAYPSFD
jgi:microcystin-dependent protein